MDQSTHDVRRASWLSIVNQCRQRPSDISVKQWLADNGIKEKAYYYWLRKFRREAYDQMQLPETTKTSGVIFAEFPIPDHTNHHATDVPAAVIKCNGLTLELSNDISGALLTRLLQEVLHA